MGFPHATGTWSPAQHGGDCTNCADASVHLTLGISVADCGLTYGTLRGQLLLEMGEDIAVDEEDLDDDTFWALLEPLRVGCLARPHACKDMRRLDAGGDALLLERVAGEVARLTARIDFAAGSEGSVLHRAIADNLLPGATRVVGRWLEIQSDLLDIYDRGYAEVAEAAACSGSVVGTGLAGRPGASSFHARRSGCE